MRIISPARNFERSIENSQTYRPQFLRLRLPEIHSGSKAFGPISREFEAALEDPTMPLPQPTGRRDELQHGTLHTKTRCKPETWNMPIFALIADDLHLFTSIQSFSEPCGVISFLNSPGRPRSMRLACPCHTSQMSALRALTSQVSLCTGQRWLAMSGCTC